MRRSSKSVSLEQKAYEPKATNFLTLAEDQAMAVSSASSERTLPERTSFDKLTVRKAR